MGVADVDAGRRGALHDRWRGRLECGRGQHRERDRQWLDLRGRGMGRVWAGPDWPHGWCRGTHGDCTTRRRGAPRLRTMILVPAKDVEIIDTWFVGGMRGTGSQDFAVHELFVPTAYTLNGADHPPLHPGPLYRLPLILTLCSGLGPLALGIARGAIDSFVELMVTKIDLFTGTALRERLTVQERVAKAEAAVRAARAFFYEMVD